MAHVSLYTVTFLCRRHVLFGQIVYYIV